MDVNYNGQQVTKLPLYIVDSEGPSLFGRDWLRRIRLDWQSIGWIRQMGKQGLDGVLNKYVELFQDGLGKVTGIKTQLRIKADAVPKFYKPRSVPFALRIGIAEEIEKLEKQGVLKKIDYSDWASPIVPVRRPNGDIRICGDYKVTVNQYIEVPEHPIPKPEDLFQKLNGGQKFTKMDLSQAYQQVELDLSSQQYLAINTHIGLYAYTRRPFGVSAAPAVFQSVMDKVLQGLDVGCFFDDLIITGRDDDEHLRNLDAVLQRLQQFGFKLQERKCMMSH